MVCCWMLVGGCLVFVGLKLFDSFSLLVVVEVMFARNIGGDGSVTMVVMDHIWVRLWTVMVSMDLWLCWFVVLRG